MSVTLVQETATRLPQNLLKYSDDLDNAIWAPTRLETVVYDATYDDWIHEPTTDTGAHYTAQTLLTTLGNSDYTLSVRLRYINHRWAVLRFYDGTDVYYQSVDLLNGALGVNLNITSESITEVSTDVYDVSFTCPAVAASSISNVVIGLNNTDTLALESWTPAGTEQIGVSRVSLENYSTAGTYTKTTSAAIAGGNRVLTRLPQNLALQSETFDNASWTKRASTDIVADQVTAPDGTVTADKMTDSNLGGASVNSVDQSVSVHAGTSCFSCYVKAGSVDIVGVGTSNFDVGANSTSYFSLTTGTVLSQPAQHVNVDIEAVGDDWYRCWVTFVTTTDLIGKVWIYMAEGDGDVTFPVDDGTHNFYIWGAQVEARPDGPGTYTATTTAVVPGVTITRASTATYFDHNGIMQTAAIGEERTDYDPSDNSLRGLLIEEARTNLCLQSEDLSTTWIPRQATISANAITAPDGTLTADAIAEDGTASSYHDCYQTKTGITDATTYTCSAYAKAGTRDWLLFQVLGGPEPATGAGFYVDLSSGTIGTVKGGTSDYGIEDVGNGWFRLWFSFLTDQAGSLQLWLQLAEADGDTTFSGLTADSLYVWGYQFEVGAAPSSYIPTTTASVTRAADNISITDLTQIGYSATAGSMLANWRHNEDFNSAQRPWSISDGTSNEQLHISRISAVAVRFSMSDGGVSQCNFGANGTFPADQNILMATAWKLNDLAASVDGGAAGSDTSATLPTVDQLWMGARYDGTANELNGHIAKLVYYPKRLPNDDLVTLSAGGNLVHAAAGLGFTMGKMGMR